jgi:hypothetical protein
MGIHDFNFNDAGPGNLKDMRTTVPKQSGGAQERNPLITPRVGTPNHNPTDLFYENININVAEDVNEILAPGFRTMDRGLKNYFSGIRIPTKNGVRMMGVRIAGGDRSFLIWKQDLKRGRTRLPVLSISRDSVTRDEGRYSPAYHFSKKRFTDSLGTNLILSFREVPYLLEYTLSIWAEHKHDAEMALYQISTRFHSTAEFVIEDQYMSGNVIMKYGNYTDASDKEIDPDSKEKVKYDISISVEGWLPLPEKVVPSILGRVTTLKEDTGEFLSNLNTFGGPNG